MGSKAAKKAIEKTTLIGARVYKRHHAMVRDISRVLRKRENKTISKSESVRRAIEKMHAELVPATN